jgi:hypothetical protein
VIAGLPLLLAALLGGAIWQLWRLEKSQSAQLKQQVSHSLWLRRQCIDQAMIAYRQAQIDYPTAWKMSESGKFHATDGFHAFVSMIATQISQIYWATQHFGADANLIGWQELRDYADNSIRAIVASNWKSLGHFEHHVNACFPPELDADRSLVDHVKKLIKQEEKFAADSRRDLKRYEQELMEIDNA